MAINTENEEFWDNMRENMRKSIITAEGLCDQELYKPTDKEITEIACALFDKAQSPRFYYKKNNKSGGYSG